LSQVSTLLSHLKRVKSKGISQREAMIDYSIQSLTKRISELREMGHHIKTIHRKHPVTGQRYARYVLER
jgi:DNA-binding HxlR family transcriptional regulator